MALSPEKRAYLVQKMSESEVAALEQTPGALKALAIASGADWKETPAAPDAPKKKPVEGSPEEEAAESPDEEAAEGDAPKKQPAGKALTEDTVRAIVRAELESTGKSIGESLGKSVTVALKAVAERVDAMEASASAAQTAAESAAKAATKSFDDAVADLIAPRRKAPGSQFRPSTADETKLAAKDGAQKPATVAQKEEPVLPGQPEGDWFTTKVLKPAGLV